MSKVKLDLKSKNDVMVLGFAKEHQAAMAGNPNFPSPEPDVESFNTRVTNYALKMDEITVHELQLQAMRSEKDALRIALEASLTERGSYVEKTSHGVESVILSAGFQVQSTPAATTSMPMPTGLVATMGDNPGEVDLSCDAVPKAKTYLYERREHSDVTAPGPWLQAKIGTRSSVTATGLTSGMKYSFRVRVLGPHELESPWSAVTLCMAP